MWLPELAGHQDLSGGTLPVSEVMKEGRDLNDMSARTSPVSEVQEEDRGRLNIINSLYYQNLLVMKDFDLY